MTKKKIDKLQKALKEHAKVKFQTMTYTWKPPTKEQIAAQEKAARKSDHDKMREVAMYIEGIKHAHLGSRINHEHTSVLWKVVEKLRNEI